MGRGRPTEPAAGAAPTSSGLRSWATGLRARPDPYTTTPAHLLRHRERGDILQGERTPSEELQSEYGSEMLAKMTSEWLDASSPELVAELRASLAQALHEQRFASVTEAEGARILKATAALMKRVRKGSRELEAYLLAQGVVKSSEWAPRGPGR